MTKNLSTIIIIATFFHFLLHLKCTYLFNNFIFLKKYYFNHGFI